MVPWPAVSGNLLEMPWAHPRTAESATVGIGPSRLFLQALRMILVNNKVGELLPWPIMDLNIIFYNLGMPSVCDRKWIKHLWTE